MSAIGETHPIAGQHRQSADRTVSGFRSILLPRLLFGLRLAASVCLALYTTYFLELPNPFWAATTAAIVCQPNLGAALQKGRFRALGTALGALALVWLLAVFPQQRVAFLACLALWCGLCGSAVVLLRNSAAYAAGLSGITAAILFADSVSDPTSAAFLAVTRVSEITIGFIAAAVIMLLTERGTARLALAGLMEGEALHLRAGFLACLAVWPETAEMQAARREVARALAPLHAAGDAAIGEAAAIYARRGNLRLALASLADALVGWRNVGHHAFPAAGDDAALRRQLALPLARINPASPEEQVARVRAETRQALADIEALRLNAAGSVSASALADATQRVASCLAHFIDLIIFLRTGAGERQRVPHQPFVIADPLPVWLAGVRATLSVLGVSLFWVATAWPQGPLAIAFAAVSTLIFASFADEARGRATDYTLGVAVVALLGSVIYFHILPALSSFPALMGLLFLLYVPIGMMQVGRWHSTLFLAMSIALLPVLGISNPMAYDPAGYFNVALALLGGSAAGTLFFVLLPPLDPDERIRRLIRLSVQDLDRLLLNRSHRAPDRWRAVLIRRLEDMPAQATLEQDAALLTLLATGTAVTVLRTVVKGTQAEAPLQEAFSALAAGDAPTALVRLEALGRRLRAEGPGGSWGEIQSQLAVLTDAIRRASPLRSTRP